MPRLRLTQEQTITEMTEEQRATHYQNQAIDAKQRISTSYLELAEAIYHLKNELFRAFNVPTFAKYCEEVLDLKMGKAYALARVWEVAVGYGISKERLEAMGWSKADMLARHVNEDNLEEIMDWAESMTLKEFTKRCSGSAHCGAGNKLKFVLTFDMSLSYSAVMAEAIEQAKKVFKSEDAAFVVSALANEWMVSCENTVQSVTAETYLRFLEKTYGGKFTYTPPEGTIKDALSEQQFEPLEVEDPLSEQSITEAVSE